MNCETCGAVVHCNDVVCECENCGDVFDLYGQQQAAINHQRED